MKIDNPYIKKRISLHCYKIMWPATMVSVYLYPAIIFSRFKSDTTLWTIDIRFLRWAFTIACGLVDETLDLDY